MQVGPAGVGQAGTAAWGDQVCAGSWCYENTCLWRQRRQAREETSGTLGIKPFCPLETDLNKGSLAELYLDLPNGGLGVDGDGGVPAPPPGGGATQRGQCGCRQAGQVTRPLEHGKNQTRF